MSRFLQGVSLNSWILAITPLFFAAFCALVLWVYRRSGRAHYQRLSELPLESQTGGPLHG